MLYNMDLQLWINERESSLERPNGGCIYQVQDGMIANGYNVLARFKTSTDAIQTLLEAGFHEVSAGKFKA